MVATSFPQSTVDLLSKIAGQPLQPKQVTSRTLFITALTTAMMGATYADGQVSDEEKQKLQQIFNQFFPSQSKMGQLVRVLGKGIQQHNIHLNPEHLSSLTYGLSESERLLILAFACEIAAADDSVAQEEIQYLQNLTQRVGIEAQYLDNFLSVVQGKSIDSSTAAEIHNLLDPHRFQDLDPIFVHVADYMVAKLPDLHAHNKEQVTSGLNFNQLEQFSLYQKQLDGFCFKLFQVIKDCEDHLGQTPIPIQEVAQLSKKLQAQKFRVAVVGEFSQGKSTLLNALLGEDIQPVRAIPCSGAITVLRHGERLRVTCCYKDGQKEEIPFEQYQDKASISEKAALCGLSDELAESTIQEIILEHPSLELCQHNVEIIDSPGLNEHPDRTAITNRLLQDVDAVIFLANASRPLTYGEKELFNQIKAQLNPGNPNKPADNLFVLVNFMDLLRRDIDRQQVQQLVQNFVYGDNPVLQGDNRLHFISAQAALDAIVNRENNEFLESFKLFTTAMEHFLTQERGAIVVQQSSNSIQRMIEESDKALLQFVDVLDNKVKVAETDHKKIVDQIGEVSGRDFKIRALSRNLFEETVDQIILSWENWAENIGDRIGERSLRWTSEHHQKDKMLQDYSEYFLHDISEELDSWLENEVKLRILKPRIELLDTVIFEELEAIKENLEALDSKIGSKLSEQFTLSLSSMGVDIQFGSSLNAGEEGLGFLGALGLGGGGGLLAGAALAMLGFGFLPVTLAAGAAGIVLGLFFGEDLEETCKREVFEKGFARFADASEEILNKIESGIASTFQERSNTASEAIKRSILILNFLLESQEKTRQETVEARWSEKAFIQEKCLELTELKQDLQALTSKALA